jgi:hypothetical protein
LFVFFFFCFFHAQLLICDTLNHCFVLRNWSKSTVEKVVTF